MLDAKYPSTMASSQGENARKPADLDAPTTLSPSRTILSNDVAGTGSDRPAAKVLPV